MDGDKVGDRAYDPLAFINRGFHELGNSLYPESSIPLRDHSGLYGSKEHRDVESSQANREVQPPTPELEHDEPELER